jgi:hypothetical protein
MAKTVKNMDAIGILLSGGVLLFFIGRISGLNTIYSACLASIVVLLAFAIFPYFKSIREMFPDGTSTFTTIASGIIFVYLTVALTIDYTEKAERNKQATQAENEKKQKIEIVKKLQNDALKVKGDLEAYYDRYYNMVNGNDDKFAEMTKEKGLIAPIAQANYINAYLNQEAGLILLHRDIIPMFSRANDDLKNMTTIIQTSKFPSLKQFKDAINLAILYCTYMVKLLDIQIEFLNGNITDDEVGREHRELSFKHFRSMTEDPNNSIKSIRILPEDRQFPLEKVLTDSALNEIVKHIEETKKERNIKNNEIILEYFEKGDSVLLPQIELFLKQKGYKVKLTGRVATMPPFPLNRGIHFGIEDGHMVVRVAIVDVVPY